MDPLSIPSAASGSGAPEVLVSYLVLARKYRPARFADIVGQSHVVRTLENAIALDRVHHAFLFTGARGVGKTSTARVLAAALNCEKGPTAEPCGTCAACVEVAAGNNPDVLEIDGASNTGVDNVRELRETVRYLPAKGRFKLYIIDEVHMLSKGAFNALLKTLEEPPPHVKFIFATTEPQKIPVTILSRCQRFDFRRVSMQLLVEQLRKIIEREGVTLGGGAVTAIAREAQGSVRDALSLLDQVLSYAGDEPGDEQVIEALGVVDRETIFSLCEAILRREATTLLELCATIDARGHDLADVAGLLVEHLRDLMVAKVVEAPPEALLDRSPSEIEGLARQAALCSRADLHRLFALMVTVAEDVSRSPHPRVSLEMGLLRLLEVEPSTSLGDLLGRLDALVAGGGIGNAKGPAPVGGVGSAPRARRGGAPQSGRDTAPSPPNPRLAPTSTGAATVASPGAPAAPARQIGWDRLVARVRELRPAFASVLEHGHVLRFAPDGVEVGFPAGTFYWERAREGENRDLLRRVLEQQFGQPVELMLRSIEDGERGEDSIVEVTARRRRERIEEIREGAMSDPMVQSAAQILDGEIKKVVPLDPKLQAVD